jgi:hypothetical protein
MANLRLVVELFLAVQKVELVGGESWLEHNTIALAAIAAASLAALVAILNRRAELRHDREMRNRDHVREVVDLSYVEAGQAMTEVSELLGLVHGTEEWREQTDAELDEHVIKAINSDLDKRDNDAHVAIMNLASATGRLEMRLGNNHPIPTTHRALREAIRAMYDRAPSSLRESRPGGAKEADIQLADLVGVAHAEFRDACFAWINR